MLKKNPKIDDYIYILDNLRKEDVEELKEHKCNGKPYDYVG